jgi:peptide/nickel transport system permease protein
MTTASMPLNNDTNSSITNQTYPKGKSLFQHAIKKLVEDRWAVACFLIIVFYALLALAAKFGLIATPWDEVVGPSYSPPSLENYKMWLGTDIFGRSVLYKVIHGTRIAMSVGLVSSLITIPIGIVLGAAAGYFGKWLDDVIVWFYTVLQSIPNLMLLIAITYALGKGIVAIYLALGVTSWIGLCRVMRGEFIKHKNREYVLAAHSLGAGHTSKIFKHILPNVFHFVIINLSIQFMSAIKAEVILTFLGLGLQGQPSWGTMIDDARLELARGVWWQLAAATAAMFFVILAFNILGDALRDALDPKIK